MTIEITKTQVEEMLEVDARSISRYQNRDIDPLPIVTKGKRGTANTYCAHQIMKWKIRREKEKYMPEDSTVLDYETERARLTHGQANKVEMETAVMRGDLIPADVVKEIQCDMIGRARSRLLAIPTKSAHAILNLTDLTVAQDILKEQIYEALDELADYDPEDYGIDAAVSGNTSNLEPAS